MFIFETGGCLCCRMDYFVVYFVLLMGGGVCCGGFVCCCVRGLICFVEGCGGFSLVN